MERETCIKCKTELHGRNAREVGYCLDCYNQMMAGDEDDDEDEDCK